MFTSFSIQFSKYHPARQVAQNHPTFKMIAVLLRHDPLHQKPPSPVARPHWSPEAKVLNRTCDSYFVWR